MAVSIGIIDYGMGNLRSVQKALENQGAEARILAGPGDTGSVGKLILPGVGAFADGMEQLRQRGWIPVIREFIERGRPFLGICLGMQLLFEGSEEDSPGPGQYVPGLAVLTGHVVRFQEGPQRLKVPHMGWNSIRWSRSDPLLAGLSQDAFVYFVHSYYCRPQESPSHAVVSAMCDYGGPFCASLWLGNIWATQFHPEKSQAVGQQILKNFVSFPPHE